MVIIMIIRGIAMVTIIHVYIIHILLVITIMMITIIIIMTMIMMFILILLIMFVHMALYFPWGNHGNDMGKHQTIICGTWVG